MLWNVMRPVTPLRSAVDESDSARPTPNASRRSRDDLRVVVIAPDSSADAVSEALTSESLPVLASIGASDELDIDGSAAPDAFVLRTEDLGPDLVAEVRAIKQGFPAAHLVIVAPSTSLRQLRVLMGEGVDAFVLEDDVERCLGLAVQSVCVGLLSFPESLRGTLARPVLSTREKQVLGLVVLGLTNSEIARKLHVSQSTVKSHLSSSFAKLGARSRSEATALILDPDTGLGTGILAISEES